MVCNIFIIIIIVVVSIQSIPLHLSSPLCRRNKDCTRSVKKKSGPAKGTKYAARRARSQDEHGRSSTSTTSSSRAGIGLGLGGGCDSGGGSGSIGGQSSLRRGFALEGAVLRRSASTGDRSSPPSSSSSSCAAMVSRDPLHAPSHMGGSHLIGSHSKLSALPPELVFSPTGRRGGDGGGSGEGDLDRGVGSPGRVADELAMRHHQHHGRGGALAALLSGRVISSSVFQTFCRWED